MREEGCHTLVAALPLLYPTSLARNELLLSLLTASSPALIFLRDRLLGKILSQAGFQICCNFMN